MMTVGAAWLWELLGICDCPGSSTECPQGSGVDAPSSTGEGEAGVLVS
jgi:hypothetical protein